MRLKSIVGLFSILSLLIVLVTGCVTTAAATETVVLERSELGRPSWVSQLREVEPLSEKWFIYEKTEIQRLDLGLRQTQASALAAHCRLLAKRMRVEVDSAVDEVLKRASLFKKGSLSPEGNKAIDSALEQLAKSDTCPELELKDVYWELLRRPSPDGPRTSYSIFVLLRLNLVTFDDVLALVADSLTLGAQAEVQPVAEILRERMSNSSQRGTNE